MWILINCWDDSFRPARRRSGGAGANWPGRGREMRQGTRASSCDCVRQEVRRRPLPRRQVWRPFSRRDLFDQRAHQTPSRGSYPSTRQRGLAIALLIGWPNLPSVGLLDAHDWELPRIQGIVSRI